jgi:hypothetical protein
MRRVAFMFLFVFMVACGGDEGCGGGVGVRFRVLPNFGSCMSGGGSTSTLISIEDARPQDELYVSARELPAGVTASWQPNMEVRSQGMMTFNCGSDAVPGERELPLSPYIVSMEGATFEDLRFRLKIE